MMCLVNSLHDNVRVGALGRWYNAVGVVCTGTLDGFLDPRKIVEHMRRVQLATYTCVSALVHVQS